MFTEAIDGARHRVFLEHSILYKFTIAPRWASLASHREKKKTIYKIIL